MADRANGTLQHQSSFWYLGHFTRFIQPGAQRVLCAAARQDLEATAFVNTDGSCAIVAMNRSEHPLTFCLALDGTTYQTVLPARSIASWVAASDSASQG